MNEPNSKTRDVLVIKRVKYAGRYYDPGETIKDMPRMHARMFVALKKVMGDPATVAPVAEPAREQLAQLRYGISPTARAEAVPAVTTRRKGRVVLPAPASTEPEPQAFASDAVGEAPSSLGDEQKRDD